MPGGEKANFFVFYEVDEDEVKHNLTLDDYGEDDRWVLPVGALVGDGQPGRTGMFVREGVPRSGVQGGGAPRLFSRAAENCGNLKP